MPSYSGTDVRWSVEGAMLSAFKARLHRHREARDERRRLDQLDKLPATIHALTPVSAIQLAELIHSPAIADEWRDVSQMMDGLETIEDMKTRGVNPGDRRALYHLVRRYEPSSVLEIGTHVAAATMSIAAALKRQPRGRLVTVDIQDVNAPDGFWHRFGLKRPPDQRMAAMGMSDRVSFVNADSLSYLRSSKETFDLIFLDGDHSATTVYREVPAALALLNEGGVIILHDLFPPCDPCGPMARSFRGRSSPRAACGGRTPG